MVADPAPVVPAKAGSPAAAEAAPVIDPSLLARSVPLQEELFGVTVADEYRWMETQDQELKTWVQAHGERTRSHLDTLADRNALEQRILELIDEDRKAGGVMRRGDRIFYLRQLRGQTQPALVTRKSIDAEDVVLFDPATQSQAGSIDNYMPSQDGKRVALNLSTAGAEISQIRVIDVRSGEFLPDVLPRVWGEFPAQWTPDGKSLAYTQMQPAQTGVDPMLNMMVRRHKLGDSTDKDQTLLQGAGNPSMTFVPQEFPILEFSADGKWAVATGHGARADVQLAVTPAKSLSAKSKWRYIAGYDGQISGYTIQKNKLYTLTTKGAPNGQVLRYDLRRPTRAPEVVVPEDPQAAIQSIRGARNGLFVERQKNGVENLEWWKFGAKAPMMVPLPMAGAISNLDASSRSDELLFRLETWTQPPQYYKWSPRASAPQLAALPSATPADFSAIQVERVEVPATDGAMVPMTLIYPKNLKKDKTAPFHVRAYGGYGMTMLPRYLPGQLAWLEKGGGIAWVHVRGSGAKGRAWHEAGKGKNKQVGVSDLIAGAKYLSQHGYSAPTKIGAQGTSMGGVLVGGALVTEPSAFGAVILSVPILNPLRILAAPNGANQISELGGSPAEAEGFAILHAMDPYPKIADNGGYPETYFEVGLHDNRVALWHPAKFAARMMAKNPQTPIWIRPDADGHGIGTPRHKIAQKVADRYAFLLNALSQ